MTKNAVVFFLVFWTAFFYAAGDVKAEGLFLEITHVEEELEEHYGYKGYEFRVTLSESIGGEIYCSFTSEDGFLVGPTGNKSENPTIKIDGRYGAVSSAAHYFIPDEGSSGTVSWQVYHEDYGQDFYELYINYNSVNILKTDNVIRKKSGASLEAEELLDLNAFLTYIDPNNPSSVTPFYPEEPVELVMSTTSQGGFFYDSEKNYLDQKNLIFPEGVGEASFHYSDSKISINAASGEHKITISSVENEKYEKIGVRVIPYIKEIFLSPQELSLAPGEEWIVEVDISSDEEKIYNDAADVLHLEFEQEEVVEFGTETGKLKLKPLEEGNSMFIFQDPLNREIENTLTLKTAQPKILLHELERNVVKNEIELKGLVENPSINSEVYVGRKSKEKDTYIWEEVKINSCGSWNHIMDFANNQEGEVKLRAAVISGENTALSEKREVQIDRTPPETSLSKPLENTVVEGEVEVIGSVQDDNLCFWKLYLISGEASSKIAQGFSNLAEREMAVFSSADLAPGEHELLLKAQDKAGNDGSCIVNIEIPRKDTDSGSDSSRRQREPLVKNARLAAPSDFSAGLYADTGNNVTISREYIRELKRGNSDLIITYPEIKFLFPADNLAGKMEVLLTEHKGMQKVSEHLTPQRIWGLRSDRDIQAKGKLKEFGSEGAQGIFTFNSQDNRWLYQGEDSVFIHLTGSEDKIIAVMKIEQIFEDIKEDHWAYEEINMFSLRGLIEAEPGENFNPSTNISRAEFTSMVARAFGSELKRDKHVENSEEKFFKDVSGGSWYYDDLRTAFKYGLIEGKGDRKFFPAEDITRQEMAVLICRVLDKFNTEVIPAERSGLIKNDAAFWAKEDMERVIGSEIIKGYPGGYILSNSEAVRAEGVKIVHRTVDIIF